MYKQRSIPVLKGTAAQYFNNLLRDGSLRDDTDYSSAARDLDIIMARSHKL